MTDKNQELKDQVKSDESFIKAPTKKSFQSAETSSKYMRVGSVVCTWGEVSKVNYFPSEPLELIMSRQSSLRTRSIGLTGKDFFSMQCFVSDMGHKSDEALFAEQFPPNVTPLMNEGNLWGCFYNFPELYADVYSPTVHILKPEDVAEMTAGTLTRDVVTTCLSYLKRTPILGDYVYIKLSLSGKHLLNIDVLQQYKYLVYLDLSSNLLTDLSVLSYLLYLQFISVAFNRLNSVLEYSTPQWFLTEVHYKYNSVKKIRDLDMFWSLTILDLSHNNIKCISGLQKLRYLRHLDLSFNHIQRLENLNHLRLLWLDVSYNNISNFEFGAQAGLWTLLHLEYLNLNENNLKSMRIFSGCTRLRELHIRNNRLSILLELAVYMRQMRRLSVLDMRANPICAVPGYQDVVFDTFPVLLSLNATELDPVPQRSSKMDTLPDMSTFATRRLLRMLYVEQLSRGHVSPHVPPADTTEVPLIVFVGYEGVGKGSLARRLASECSTKIQLAIQHTTADFHYQDHYRVVNRNKFDDMLLAGEFLTYSEMDGESYGLSREEAYIKDGKVRVCCMDLISALMLKLRGRRPFLILTSYNNKRALASNQLERRTARNATHEKQQSFMEGPLERSTLQVLLSGRIIITGILNEILICLPEEKNQSEFVIESECSLLMDSEARKAAQEYARGANLLTLMTSSVSSLEGVCKRSREACKGSQMDTSLYSLYKESQGTEELTASDVGPSSYDDRNFTRRSKKDTNIEEGPKTHKNEKVSSVSHPKSYDFSKYTSSTWKGFVPDSTKSSKSVTFTSQDAPEMTGLNIDPQMDSAKQSADKKNLRSISNKLQWPAPARSHNVYGASPDDLDLWLAFLVETGLLQSSDIACASCETYNMSFKAEEPDSIIRHLNHYVKITMDDPEKAFRKAKKIIRDIVNEQCHLQPMFDIDFTNLDHYPTVAKRLESIRQQIAPRKLFY
ncbi:uncharacterized protein isoform X2 [Choristoneura fumiferana]|uniref:uncharacterized protein isoform X2 n=1 Tax=Choristoneura fumiferana TaxID=7141 RepID=UPI003D15D440